MKTAIFTGIPNGQRRNGTTYLMEPCNRAMRRAAAQQQKKRGADRAPIQKPTTKGIIP